MDLSIDKQIETAQIIFKRRIRETISNEARRRIELETRAKFYHILMKKPKMTLDKCRPMVNEYIKEAIISLNNPV